MTRPEVQPDVEHEQDLEQDLGFTVAPTLGEQAKVLLHNDDTTNPLQVDCLL